LEVIVVIIIHNSTAEKWLTTTNLERQQ